MDILATFNNDTGVIEWGLLPNGDLAMAYQDLTSAVMCQLFSDARCDDSFIPADGDRRGHWTDSYSQYPIGSKLWTLARAAFSGKRNILLAARDYTKQALQPLIDMGVTDKIDVDVAQIGQNGISLAIVMYQPVTNGTLTFNFAYLWQQIAGNPANINPIPPTIVINSILDSGFFIGYSRWG